MIVSLVVAMDEKGGIAWQGQLPWHLPTELKLFKRTTLGHHLLMGRKTFETIGKPLPGRTTIVITRQQDYASYAPEGCLVVHSLEEGLILARSKGETEVFVCGGREIYAQALPLADRMYLTTIHTVVPTDMNFPAFKPEEWLETSRLDNPADDKNPFAFTRQILVKKNWPQKCQCKLETIPLREVYKGVIHSRHLCGR